MSPLHSQYRLADAEFNFMLSVTLQISDLPNTASAKRKSLPYAVVDGTTITMASPLSSDVPLNDHLVWLWEMLKRERRYLKSLKGEGAQFEVYANGAAGRIEIKPNGAELLHLLGVTLVLSTSGN
jgi:hypothetical protein